MAATKLWHIQLFGVLQLTTGDLTLSRFRTQMTGSLLAYLAYYGGRPQPREVLIEQFWPDLPAKTGRSRLSIALSSLRTQLSSEGGGTADLIIADNFTVALNLPLFEVDTVSFQKALKQAYRTPSASERTLWLEKAIALYTGDLLVGRYEPWIVPEQENLRDQLEQAQSDLARLRKDTERTGTRRLPDPSPPRVSAPLAGERAVPALSAAPTAGTFTALLVEGDERGRTVMETLAGRQGGMLLESGPVGSLLVLFGDSAAALSVAIAGMSEPECAAVRAGLDTGFVTITGRSGEGGMLRMVSRLMGAAYPGQILCSEVTAALAWQRTRQAGGEPGVPGAAGGTDYRLRDLGRFQLTEASAPERLFQVESARLPPALFPPPRIAQGYAPTLPPTFTRFFGRATEIDALAARLTGTVGLTSTDGQAPLLCLTGIGGIGKTRLAIEVATRALKAFDGRVWFVSLGDLSDAVRIPEAIRDALPLPKDAALDAMEQCVNYLSSAPSLLVLDGMERFAASGQAAALVHTLRARLPLLACLVTSRQTLGVENEDVFPVGSLSPADAPDTADRAIEASVLLFADRARAVLPHFAVTPHNTDVLTRLCRALEGIPLAIELAAARSGLVTPAQMLEQMERRFALLRSRRRDLPERHRSLWAAVDSSYQLLPPDLRRVFAGLSVFRGGWTLQAAQSVCLPPEGETGEPDAFFILEAMAELQECSLILAVGGAGETVRFRMLDTLREFGTEKLRESPNEAVIRGRYQAFFAGLADLAEPHLAAGGTAQELWLNRVEADHDNLRALLDSADPQTANALQSLQTATALHRFWLVRGYAAEGQRYLAASLAHASPEVSPFDRAKAQNALGILAWATGALEMAQQQFTHALERYRVAGEPGSIARVLNNLGIVAAQNGYMEMARASYEESLALYRTLGDALRQSMVSTNLGGALISLKEYDAARRILEESLSIQRTTGDGFSASRTLQSLAEVGVGEGDLNAAAADLSECLKLRQTLGDQSAFSDVLATAAVIAGQWNLLEEAVTLWGAAQGVRASTETLLIPTSATVEMEYLARLGQALPQGRFDTAYQAGRAMNFEQSLLYAAGQLRNAPHLIGAPKE